MNIEFYHNPEYADNISEHFSKIGYNVKYICSFNCPYTNTTNHIVLSLSDDKEITIIFIFNRQIYKTMLQYFNANRITDLDTFKEFVINTYSNEKLCNQLIKQQIIKDL